MEKLKEIEKTENVTVLYAAETGSRAWGHSNENSDYDIRFIYRQNDISQYLVLDRFCDVIQYEDDVFDFVGWDVKKALYLHFKSNPNLREWLISHEVYVPDEIGIFRDFDDFNPEILKYHYYGLASKTYKKYIKGSSPKDLKVVKKTLYVIRCTLAWKLLEKGMLPGMDFNALIEESDISDDLKKSIMTLRQAYSQLAVDKVSDGDVEMIHTWIVESLKGFEKKSFDNPKRNIEDYNERFFEIIGLD